MKHLFVFAVVFAAFSLCAESQKATITAGVLNVRVKPSAKSDTLLQLKRGDEVVVLERGNEWTAIRPPEKSSLYVSSPLIVDGKMKSNGNLRAGSGVNFQSLCILPAGTPVTVIEDKNSWSRIAVPSVDVRCYVASRYLKFAEAPEKTEKVKKVVQKPVKKGDVVSFSAESLKSISKDYVKGTGKKVTLTGKLITSSSKAHGKTFVLAVGERYYHLAGVIPGALNRDKEVTVKGVSHMVREWSVPIIEIESISQK